MRCALAVILALATTPVITHPSRARQETFHVDSRGPGEHEERCNWTRKPNGHEAVGHATEGVSTGYVTHHGSLKSRHVATDGKAETSGLGDSHRVAHKGRCGAQEQYSIVSSSASSPSSHAPSTAATSHEKLHKRTPSGLFCGLGGNSKSRDDHTPRSAEPGIYAPYRAAGQLNAVVAQNRGRVAMATPAPKSGPFGPGPIASRPTTTSLGLSPFEHHSTASNFSRTAHHGSERGKSVPSAGWSHHAVRGSSSSSGGSMRGSESGSLLGGYNYGRGQGRAGSFMGRLRGTFTKMCGGCCAPKVHSP